MLIIFSYTFSHLFICGYVVPTFTIRLFSYGFINFCIFYIIFVMFIYLTERLIFHVLIYFSSAAMT